MRSFIEKVYILFLFAFIFFGENFGQTTSVCTDCVPNQVLVELAPTSQNQLSAVAAQYKLKPNPLGQIGSPASYQMEVDTAQTTQTAEQIVALMQGDVRITKAEVNRKFSAVERENLPWTLGHYWSIGHSWSIGGSAKGFHRQWFPDLIRLNQAHTAPNGSTGAGVIVAVLDTGIDLNHPAFAGKLVPGYDFVGNDNNPSEEGVLRQNQVYGHGTHVAGIVALTAPDAKIMPIRVLDSNGEGELWRITAAIIWAANHGADVINISFGYPQDAELLKNLLHNCGGITPVGQTFPELNGNQMIVIAGAGNGGQIGNGTNPIFPGGFRFDAQLGVGASTRYDRLADFSTFERDNIRAVAPGENIISAIPGGRYGAWSGTSMAAPIVSGIAALVRAKNPNFTPHQIVEQIEETGIKWDYVHPTRNVRIKTSRVDAFCAVMNNQTCTINLPAFKE